MIRLRNKIPAVFLLVFTVLLSNISFAQSEPTNRAKNRAKWKMNRKVDEKVDNTVDDAFNAVGNLFKKKKKNREEPQEEEDVEIVPTDEGAVITDGSDRVEVDFDDEEFEVTPSEFIGSYRMDITSSKNGKVKKDGESSIHYFIDEYKFAFKLDSKDTKENPATMIYDLKTRKVTTLTIEKGKKQGMRLPMPRLSATVDSEDVMGEDMKLTKTSETKTVEGYPCVKYLFDSEKMEGEMWITDEVVVDMGFVSNMVNLKRKDKAAYTMRDWYGVEGTALESHMTDKKNGEKTDTYVRAINIGSVDQSIFDTSEYEITDVSNFNIFGN